MTLLARCRGATSPDRAHGTARASITAAFSLRKPRPESERPATQRKPPQSDPVFVNSRLRLSAYRERPVYLEAHAHRTAARTRHRSPPLLLSAHYSTAARNREPCDDTLPTFPLRSRSRYTLYSLRFHGEPLLGKGETTDACAMTRVWVISSLRRIEIVWFEWLISRKISRFISMKVSSSETTLIPSCR